MKKFTTQDVYTFLPHRPPFLFVDEIVTIDCPVDPDLDKKLEAKEIVGSKIHAKFKVTDSLEILKGHFPGSPILPGVVQIEMMAQTACFLNYLLFEKDIPLSEIKFDIRLLGVDKARFRKAILPGMELDIFIEATKIRGAYSYYAGVIKCGNDVVCDGEILAHFTKI